MRKNRIWPLALAVILVGSTVVMALSFAPISAVLKGLGATNVSNPTLNGPFWVQPLPSSVIAGSENIASFTVGNPYPFNLVNLELIMNFTGSGVTTSCVTAANCVAGTATVPNSGTLTFAFCTSCAPTTSTGSPEFLIIAIVPTLPSGIDTVSITLDFQHAGAFNPSVFFALNAPYP